MGRQESRSCITLEYQGEEELANNDVEEVDMWEESYGGHQDSKPKGPTAVAVDFTFAGMPCRILQKKHKSYYLLILQEQTMCTAFLNMPILFH